MEAANVFETQPELAVHFWLYEVGRDIGTEAQVALRNLQTRYPDFRESNALLLVLKTIEVGRSAKGSKFRLYFDLARDLLVFYDPNERTEGLFQRLRFLGPLFAEVVRKHGRIPREGDDSSWVDEDDQMLSLSGALADARFAKDEGLYSVAERMAWDRPISIHGETNSIVVFVASIAFYSQHMRPDQNILLLYERLADSLERSVETIRKAVLRCMALKFLVCVDPEYRRGGPGGGKGKEYRFLFDHELVSHNTFQQGS